MKAVILAGGKGDRLRPLTNKVPKALVPIAKVPMVERQIRTLEQAGIKEIIVFTNYKGKMIKNYLTQRKSKTKIRCLQKATKSDVEAFFTLKNILKENFLLLKCDLIFNPKALDKFVKYVKKTPADLILAITKTISDPRNPSVLVNRNFEVIRMGSGVKGKYFAVGVYACAPTIFSEITKAKRDKITTFSEFIIRLLIRKGYRIRGYEFPEVYDVNTPQDLKNAEKFLAKK